MKDFKPDLKYGFWYRKPYSLSWEGWDEWEEFTKKQFPIQYRIRNGYQTIARNVKHYYKEIYWSVYRFFNPCHKDIRKAIPRQWRDISGLIVDVNFAMIKSFKEEADSSYVDWKYVEDQVKFKQWLDSAYNYITVERPTLEKQQSDAYPSHEDAQASLCGSKEKSYDELYGEVNRIEKLIDNTDTKILKEMIEYRDYMWT